MSSTDASITLYLATDLRPVRLPLLDQDVAQDIVDRHREGGGNEKVRVTEWRVWPVIAGSGVKWWSSEDVELFKQGEHQVSAN